MEAISSANKGQHFVDKKEDRFNSVVLFVDDTTDHDLYDGFGGLT